jgi:uncharacterized protein YceK
MSGNREPTAVASRFLAASSIWLVLAAAGCSSISTNTALLTDQSHLGTPYSGTRADTHVLYCFGREVSRDATVLILTPFALLFLIDLPLSIALDTLLLPIDIPMEPEASPSIPGRGGCKLIGM